MTSYFEIYDDQENKTMCFPGKAPIKKQTRSVLGEISQNTQKRQKRITKSDGFQSVFPILNNKADELNTRIVSSSDSSLLPDDIMDHCSLSSNDSSVFQDNSMDNVSLASSGFRDVGLPSPTIEENITQDILTVPEYSREIYQFLKDSELRRKPRWNYMDKQTDITFNMRAILVDWLVEVSEEYKLKTETVYLAVSYTDRFLSSMSVVRSKLQLVGIVCLLIAAKYEEIYPPGVGEFAFITNDSYTKKQVLRMEHLVLKVLGFDVSMPTSHEFVNQNCQMFHMDGKALHLTLYLNELSLLDGRTFLKFPASVVAASSVVLARHTLGMTAWTDAMGSQTGYCLDDLKECVVGLYEAFKAADTSLQQTIREKYTQTRFTKVADVSPVDIM